MAAKNDYDIILNDIQMPIMSGFDATTAIREEGPVEKRYTPIIVMIAHAMAGDSRRWYG